MQYDGHEGRTKDFSSRGVYFLTVAPLETGDSVDMKVTLSHASVTGPLHLQMRVRIIRVEPLDNLCGVAAEIDSWEVLDEAPEFYSES